MFLIDYQSIWFPIQALLQFQWQIFSSYPSKIHSNVNISIKSHKINGFHTSGFQFLHSTRCPFKRPFQPIMINHFFYISCISLNIVLQLNKKKPFWLNVWKRFLMPEKKLDHFILACFYYLIAAVGFWFIRLSDIRYHVWKSSVENRVIFMKFRCVKNLSWH